MNNSRSNQGRNKLTKQFSKSLDASHFQIFITLPSFDLVNESSKVTTTLIPSENYTIIPAQNSAELAKIFQEIATGSTIQLAANHTYTGKFYINCDEVKLIGAPGCIIQGEIFIKGDKCKISRIELRGLPNQKVGFNLQGNWNRVENVSFHEYAVGVLVQGNSNVLKHIDLLNSRMGIQICGNFNKLSNVVYSVDPFLSAVDGVAICFEEGEGNGLDGFKCQGFTSAKFKFGIYFESCTSNHVIQDCEDSWPIHLNGSGHRFSEINNRNTKIGIRGTGHTFENCFGVINVGKMVNYATKNCLFRRLDLDQF